MLDLDATYLGIIKPAVTDAGLECVRGDEIVHSGVIDVPTYRQLLNADVVVADLSTANPNALYELGVRHALRPFATIVLAESPLTYPFDLNHTVIRRYPSARSISTRTRSSGSSSRRRPSGPTAESHCGPTTAITTRVSASASSSWRT